LLRKCLESLRRQSFADFEIVLVANGAGDWAESLAKEFGAKLVRFAENRGFAPAINAGIAASEPPLVLLLNDDVELDPAWLEKTTALLEEKPDISFCCGKIYQSDGRTIDNAGDALSMGGAAWRLGYGRADAPEFDVPRSLIAISMTAALFRRAVFDRIGLLDENFFSYLEDMDFSIRLWRAGLNGMYLPQATARHHGGASSAGDESAHVFQLMTQNQLALLSKHFPLALWLRLYPRIFWSQLLWSLMAFRKGRPGAYWLGGIRGSWISARTWLHRTAWRKSQRQAFLGWLRKSERAIYEDIFSRPRNERDSYWRMYFALFRAPRQTIAETRSREHPQEQSPNGEAGSSPPRRAGASSR
jgi:GT2 family glycosyltransferase